MAYKGYGIDLGTKNIKIYKEKQGIVIDQKNTIAVNDIGKVLAIGDGAYEMYEKTPETITVTFPVKYGVIAEFSSMQELLHNFLCEQLKGGSGNKDVFIAVPTNITDVEKRAFAELVENSKLKAKHVYMVEKPIADAVGAGLDIKSPKGVMLVDIGADTTEVTIMSLGGIVVSKLLQIGGNQLDEDIVQAIKREANVIIGMKSAEQCKRELSSALPNKAEEMTTKGRYLVTGLPATITVSSELVYNAVAEDLRIIMEAIKVILERTPPEISSDIIDHGVYVTGGGSKIEGLGTLIEQETHLKANLFDKPEASVIMGLGRIIEEQDLRDLAFSELRPSYV